MIFSSILLLAVSSAISSPYLGRFFTLPGWIGQASVSSDRTFGSADAVDATHRVDDKALKAVNSIFEAACEREYWAWAGNENSWKTADYGPICRGTDKHGFRFDLPKRTRAFSYLPGDALELSTRRLTEEVHVNLESLSKALSKRRGPYQPYIVFLGDVIGCDRPGWRTNVLWSSTAFDLVGLGYFYPDDPDYRFVRPVEPAWPLFDWSSVETISLSFSPWDWALSSARWDNLSGYLYDAAPIVFSPPNDEFSWASGRSEQYGGSPLVPGCFAHDAWDAVNFGEPPFHTNYFDVIQTMFPADGFVTNTTEWLIGQAFGDVEIGKETVSVPVQVPVDDLKESTMWKQEFSPADMAYQAIVAAVGGESEFLDRAPYLVDFSLSAPAHIVAPMSDFFGERNALVYCEMAVDSVTDFTGGVVRVYGGGAYFDAYVSLPEEVANDPERYNLRLGDGSSAFPAAFEMSLDVMDIGITYPYGYGLVRTDGPTEGASYNFWTALYDRPLTNSLCKVHGMYDLQTRRLIADRAAAASQCLSMIDRTYLVADVRPDFEATNVAWTGEIYFVPSTNDEDYVDVVGENYRMSDGVIVADLPGDLPVPDPIPADDDAEYFSVTNVTRTGDRIVKAVSPTGTEIAVSGLGESYSKTLHAADVIPEPRPPNDTLFMDYGEFLAFEANVGKHLEAIGETSPDVYLDKVGLKAGPSLFGSGYDITGKYPDPDPVPSVPGYLFSAYADGLPVSPTLNWVYMRRYWYTSTGDVAEDLDDSIVYPCPQSVGVVRDARLHTLASLASCSGATGYVYSAHRVDDPERMDPVGSNMRWSPDCTNSALVLRFDTTYATGDDGYHAVEGGMTGVIARVRRDVVDRIERVFANLYSADPENPRDVIPMSSRDPVFANARIVPDAGGNIHYGIKIPGDPEEDPPLRYWWMVGVRWTRSQNRFKITAIHYRFDDGHVETRSPPANSESPWVPYGKFEVSFGNCHVEFPTGKDSGEFRVIDTHGTSVNAKMRHQSMVDWKWGALRREND